MIFSSQFKMTGWLNIKKFNALNELVLDIDVPNIVVATGKSLIAARLVGYVGSSAEPISHMAVGSNGSTPLATDIELKAEIAGARVSIETPIVVDSVITYVATFGLGIAGIFAEAGLFNASSNGTMLSRTTFPPISKLTSESITITWNVSAG